MSKSSVLYFMSPSRKARPARIYSAHEFQGKKLINSHIQKRGRIWSYQSYECGKKKHSKVCKIHYLDFTLGKTIRYHLFFYKFAPFKNVAIKRFNRHIFYYLPWFFLILLLYFVYIFFKKVEWISFYWTREHFKITLFFNNMWNSWHLRF